MVKLRQWDWQWMKVIVTPQSTIWNTQAYSECIPVDSGVTNLIHDRLVVLISRLKSRRMWLDVSTQA